MVRRVLVNLFIALALTLPAASASAIERVRIALLSDTDWVLEPYDEVIREEISALLEGEFEIEFPEDAHLRIRGSDRDAQTLLSELLSRPDVDLIVALGPGSTHALAQHPALSKPCFGTTVIERELQGFPLTEAGTSGQTNLTYLVDDLPLSEVLGTFRELAPLSNVGLVLDQAIAAQIPAVRIEVGSTSEKSGLFLQPIPTDRDLTEVLDRLPEGLDGIVIGPLLEYDADEVREFAQGLIERRLPSFAIVSSREVELGLLAAISPTSDLRRVGRRLALQIQDTLLGKKPQDLPVEREVKRELTLNMATANAIGLPIRHSLMERAVLLSPDSHAGARSLTLYEAVQESIEANLDLQSQDRVVAAGREDILIALAQLLPRASASAGYGWNDGSEIARSRSGSAGLSGELVLFNEPLLGNLKISQYSQEALEAAREQVRQDVAQSTGTAFLQVLRAETALRIQRENLRVTRINLDLAQTRKRVGTAAAGEVYRWESQEANALSDLGFARADVENARISLNRILNRRLSEDFIAEDVGMADLAFTLTDPVVQPYFEVPAYSDHISDFLVRAGLQEAPELAVFDGQIRAQRRLLETRGRTFFMPRIAASASLDRVFDQEVGSANPPDTTNWTAGVQASIPLSEGGQRLAERRQAREDLARLRLDRRSQSQKVEERIRIAANTASASFTAIELNQRAAEAGARTLELVTESYSRGAVNIIDLLDAQNNSVSANQLAANAVYDHLIDLLELQRGVGQIEFLLSESEKKERLSEMRRFLKNRAPLAPLPAPRVPEPSIQERPHR